MSAEPATAAFRRLVGQWTTVATHPEMPGVTVDGTMVGEWLEGERFLLIRARTDHPQFPDSLVVIGDMTQDRASKGNASRRVEGATSASMQMHYFDSMGCSGISRRA